MQKNTGFTTFAMPEIMIFYFLGRCITAMSKKFHPEHFTCAFCLKQLNKGTFKEMKAQPYCHQCHTKLFGTPEAV